MNRFRFQATDPQGNTQTGTVEATDRQEAERLVNGRGLSLQTLTPALLGRVSAVAPLSDREVTELVEQLRSLTQAGMPLPSGLRAASQELESAQLRATFERLADHLDQGRGLDSALVAEAGRFPGHLQGLVLAGARIGRLADVLGEVVQASNLGVELRRKVWASIAYPLAILGVVIGLTFFICHLSRRIAEQISVGRSFGIEGSPTAEIIYEFTRFVADNDLMIAGGMALATVLAYLGWRFLLSSPTRQRLLESVPLYGTMIRFMALAEFCHLTALLVEAETPLPEALNLAGGSVRDAALAETCGKVAEQVAGGQSLAVALRGWVALPASLGQILAWGENQGDLARALRFAGDVFETRAEAQANFSSQAIGAILLILILCWVGFAIALIYLPISLGIHLLTALSG